MLANWLCELILAYRTRLANYRFLRARYDGCGGGGGGSGTNDDEDVLL